MQCPRNVTLGFALALFATTAVFAAPPRQPGATHAFAQNLVNQLHSAHPEFSEIGISAVIPGEGCYGLASTDKTDIGEKCESDDVVPLHTGRASIGTEGKNLDISLPLHDASGNVVGVVGIETAPGGNRAATISNVRAAVRKIEQQIPSKSTLIS
ncbi:hypothetical protein [Acidipila rosea]|uniref:Cache domain-containing protein n=1 Tax=Acidipila rosea TaxID=768535 RepID=A0A4V2PVW3_9BACT|nr:hypothetical protein [Acidipila rosea]TCK75911.1 hypothetical protein C7378_0911 [Acidipila rosea]